MGGQTEATPNATLRPVALRLERFLLLRGLRELTAPLCPDFDQWLCALPQARALGREVHGI